MPAEPVEEFAALVDVARPRVPLDRACLAVARQALPDLDVDAELRRLDELAAGVREPSIDGVVGHLVGDLGFAGDADTYHDARNSLLPAVLDRRLGIPLTLSVVAMEVGRRVGVTIDGIGMPGHFLVREAGQDERYHDVYAQGRVLDPAGCRRIFAGLHPRATWDDRYLEPIGERAIVARMLGNLAGAHRRSGDKRGLAWVLRLRLALPGATPAEHRELAVLLGSLGRFDEGAEILERLDDDRDAVSAARLRARLN
ncbi:MAG: transglutaminase-like domain-containing protein [Actinomycetota bacterium]|nr:transglutaminase-like domain-containing protein [Actinomycetota bacterium]